MDVKSAFLEQPPGFEDDKKPDHMYKLKKALYGYNTKCLCFLSLSLKLAIEWAIAPVSTFLCFIGSFEL